MTPFELLTDVEKDTIVSYIRDYGQVDGAVCKMASVDKILAEWDYQKSKYLMGMFGNSLIKEVPFCFEKNRDLIIKDFDIGLCWGKPMAKFMQAFAQTIRSFYEEPYSYTIGNHEYQSVRLTKDYDELMSMFWPEKLLVNECGFTLEVPLPDDKKYKIVPNTKITRALGKIAKAYGLEEEYEKFRIAHSFILNDKVVKGTLCLSIHPMDYMTMSDNACGWQSCMSWMDNGDYRAGTVEMLNSPNVVVAYLKSENDMDTCRDYQWNSKKWRTLAIVTKDAILNVKNYPYRCEQLTADVLKHLAIMAHDAYGWEYEDDVTHYGHYRPFEHNGNTIEVRAFTEVMYNDFNSKQEALFAKEIYADSAVVNYKPANETYVYDIGYSGPATCMWCGSETDLNSNRVLCHRCEPVTCCASCGDILHEDEIYWYGDDAYCECCYNDMFREDEMTGEYVHEEDCVGLTLL